MPNWAWSSPRSVRAASPAVNAARARSAQRAVRSTASRTTSVGDGQRRAHVEHHLDVGAELLLDAHRALGA